VCTAPSTTGYDFNVARGALTIDGFGVTGLSCAAGYTGSATPSVCLSPGAAYSVTGCEPTCNTPTMAGYDFASAGGAVTITGFGPTGLTCAMGYVGLVTASACSLPGIAYSVTGCEPTCKVHGCSAGYVDKGGVESTANPSDAVCCDAVCTAPSAAGYNFATSAGVLKIAGFGPTGLTCANGYVGLVTASACSSPGAAYSVTGCEPTCKVYGCSAGYVDKGGVESTANPSDAVCCDAVCKAPSARGDTRGYNLATASGVLKIAGFYQTGLTCAYGYVGFWPKATVCSSPGAAYSLTGCSGPSGGGGGGRRRRW